MKKFKFITAFNYSPPSSLDSPFVGENEVDVTGFSPTSSIVNNFLGSVNNFNNGGFYDEDKFDFDSERSQSFVPDSDFDLSDFGELKKRAEEGGRQINKILNDGKVSSKFKDGLKKDLEEAINTNKQQSPVVNNLNKNIFF